MKKKILMAVLLVYLVGVAVFSFITFPNTYVNGEDRSFQTKAEVFIQDTTDYTLNIVGRSDKKDTFSPASIQYQEALKGDVALNQNPFLWFLSFFQKDEYTVDYDVTYNEDKLTAYIISSPFMKDAVAPENATLEKTDQGYQIKEEILGDKIDAENLKSAVLDGLQRREETLDLEEFYEKPTVKKDDPKLAEQLKLFNELAAFTITYDFGDRKEVLEGEGIIALFTEKDGSYTLNEEKVKEYVQTLASKYDTMGNSRTFTPTGGGEITVKGGIYGWQTDVSKSTQELVRLIGEGKTVTVEPVYKAKGLLRTADDLGNTYIEIDLTRQHLWFYKDGSLVVETDIVTGDPSAGHATPTGVGKVWSRETDRMLTGEGYSSHVDFWMPVNWSGVGIHNASWRSSFGGGIYRGNGSHGCINLPYAPTKTIYNNVEINTPVVIYKS